MSFEGRRSRRNEGSVTGFVRGSMSFEGRRTLKIHGELC
jgi:hypothetical protein